MHINTPPAVVNTGTNNEIRAADELKNEILNKIGPTYYYCWSVPKLIRNIFLNIITFGILHATNTSSHNEKLNSAIELSYKLSDYLNCNSEQGRIRSEILNRISAPVCTVSSGNQEGTIKFTIHQEGSRSVAVSGSISLTPLNIRFDKVDGIISNERKVMMQVFGAIPFMKKCVTAPPNQKETVYSGDMHGSVCAVLHSLYNTGHIDISPEQRQNIEKLGDVEQKLFNILEKTPAQSHKYGGFYTENIKSLAEERDSLADNIFHGITVQSEHTIPSVLTGDVIGDRLSTEKSDFIVLDLIQKSGPILLAGDHETLFNGNYFEDYVNTRFPSKKHDPLFPQIKKLPFCHYDESTNTLATHNGISLSEGFYKSGPYTVEASSVKTPEQLAEAFNKQHTKAISSANDRTAFIKIGLPGISHRPTSELLNDAMNKISARQVCGHDSTPLNDSTLMRINGVEIHGNSMIYIPCNSLFAMTLNRTGFSGD